MEDLQKELAAMPLELQKNLQKKGSTLQLLRAFYERQQPISETLSDFSHGAAGGPPAEDNTRNCGRPGQDVALATH